MLKRVPRVTTARTTPLLRSYEVRRFSSTLVPHQEQDPVDESELVGEYYNPTGEKLALIGPKIPVTLIPEYDMAYGNVFFQPDRESTVEVHEVENIGYVGTLTTQ